MKKAISEESVQRIFALIEEITKVDRLRAIKILAEIEQFLEETDFSMNEVHQINMLIGVARFHINGRDARQAFNALNRALQIAEGINSLEEILHVRSTMAIINSMRGEHVKAIIMWEDMLHQMEPGHKLWMPIVNNLAVAYGYTKQFSRAIDLSFKLLHHMDENGYEPIDRISILINLGNSYVPLKKCEQALSVYREALELAEQANNAPYECYVHGNIAKVYGDMKDYDKAYEHAVRTVEISENYYGEAHLADSLIALASTCIKMHRYDEAKPLIERGLSLIDQEDDIVGYTNGLIASATLELETGQAKAALENLEKARKLCEDGDVYQHRKNLYRLFSEYYVLEGDYSSANLQLKKMIDMQEEIYEELSDSMISKQEAEYLRYKIEKQNESLRAKNSELEKSNKLIKRQSAQLTRSNRELQSSLAMLNRLISIISHDVRGPAANSSAALQMILDGQLAPEASGELIGHVVNSLEEVTDLLTEIMVWIESRSFKKDVDRLMKDVRLSSMIGPVLKFFRGNLKQKQIEVETEFEKDDFCCHTEPNILKIVLRNIISNAIKFSDPKSKIKISCWEDGEFLQLRVTDFGVGMSKAELKALKKDGLKARSGTHQEIGMGMGLNLSLAYLKPLGIRYDIHSEVDQGTQFTLSLPKPIS